MAVDKDKPQDEASMLRFCRVILGWDYFRLLKESNQNNKNNKKVDGSSLGLKKVKDTYSNVDDYLATFEPLLFEEVKAQIFQKKDDEEVQDWKLGLVMECSEADGFHFPVVRYAADEGQSISPNDLLLLSEEEFKEGSKFPTTYAFALVEHTQGNLRRLRMYLAGEVMHIDLQFVYYYP